MKKGFTLIELLGVIVVLTVIALIAIPTITGVIEKTRKNALQNSGYGLVEAGNLYNAQYQNGETIRFDIENNEITSPEENKLSYKGKIKEGTVLINHKGEVVICINDGKYAAYKNFKDNKVTVVDNKTCTIPENSNIVYLDNVATIDISNEELLSRIESLENTVREQKEEIDTLKGEKANQTEVINQITNINNTHRVDMTNVNNRLDHIMIDIDQHMRNKVHSIEVYDSFNSKTTLSNTGIGTTIPTNSYFCLTAVAIYSNGIPVNIAIQTPDESFFTESGEVNYAVNLETTVCGVTYNTEAQLQVYAKYDTESTNKIRLRGFYIN